MYQSQFGDTESISARTKIFFSKLPIIIILKMTLTPINQSIYKFWHIKDNLYNSLLITYALIILFLFVAV
jgi:hypothetical protein